MQNKTEKPRGKRGSKPAAKRPSDAHIVPATAPAVKNVTLPAALDIRAAKALKDQLNGLYEDRLPCTLDAHAIEKTSTVALQLLTAFFAATASAGIPARLSRPSAAFTSAAADLGLARLLEQWELGN